MMRFWCFILFLLLVFPLHARKVDFAFTNLSVPDGLVNKTVTCIEQDSLGFLWAGTIEGLSRFDGTRFKNYTHKGDDPSSLNGSHVLKIIAAQPHYLWLLTVKGLELFDMKTETFHAVNVPPDTLGSNISCISSDSKGNVWTYGEKTGFYMFSVKGESIVKKKVTSLSHFVEDSSTIIHNFKPIDDDIWFATSTAILRFNLPKHKADTLVEFPNPDYCHTLKLAPDGEVLFTYFQNGAYCINRFTGECKMFTHRFLGAAGKAGMITEDAIKFNENSCWIASNQGLFWVSDEGLEHYWKGGGDYYFEGDMASVLFQDKDSCIWIGTFENGLYRIQKQPEYIRSYQTLFNERHTSVRCLRYFDNGLVLFSDLNNCYIADSYKNLTESQSRLFKKGSLMNLYAVDGKRCILTSNDSLYLFDSQSLELSFLFSVSATISACIDNKGTVWVGTWSDGIKGIKPETGELFAIELDNQQTLKNSGFELLADPDGSLWVGTFGAGLVHVINPYEKTPELVRYVPQDGENSISSLIVKSLFDDGLGNIWIGTSGGGLNCFDKAKGTFDVYDTSNGLNSNEVESVLSDSDGNIWFASQGIGKINAKTKEITIFSIDDGAFGSYIAKASALLPSGRLCFGSTRGLTVVNPRITVRTVSAKPPIFTALKLFGMPVSPGDSVEGAVPYTCSVSVCDSLKLPYNINSFAIEFSSIQFLQAEKLMYRYKLQGASEKWTMASGVHSVSYAGLLPGEYIFVVAASIGNTEWSLPRKLHITIVPPWWDTLWFRITILVCTGVLVAGFVIFRFKRVKVLNTRLQEEVAVQTSELKEVNQILEQRNLQMQDQHRILRVKNGQLKDALTSKDELIRMLGHDLKNPLSALMGISELLKKESKNSTSKIKKFAKSIHQSSLVVNNQVSSILEWALSQDKNLESVPVEINVALMLDDAISLIAENANQKEISLTTQYEFEHNVYADPKMINAVFRNVLSNAVKFTPRKGGVHVMVQEVERFIEVSVIDTGIGMDADMISFLMSGDGLSDSTLGTENERGTGLGFAISKAFVKKNNGVIKVSSKKGEGSVFTICLPLAGSKAVPILSQQYEQFESDSFEAGQTVSVLLIDDDPEILEMLHSLLEKRFSVFKAKNGNEGLFLARSIVPDVIISDVNLPGESGLSVCRKLKDDKLTSHIPLILISSMPGEAVEEDSYLHGASDFIRKPFNLFALKQKINTHLAYKNKESFSVRSTRNAQAALELPQNHESKLTEQITAYIFANISNTELNTEMIADEMGISRTQLWRVLKNSTGQSARDLIRNIRMEKSTELLKTGRYRVSEVAYEVGYSDPAYFGRSFAKIYGMSPTAYQEQNSSADS